MGKRLTNARLREFSPFLKSGAVRPGDVLLTRGRGGESAFIAAMTRGSFSHAALWLCLEHSTVPVLFEADDLGVGFTPLTPIHFRAGSTLISTYSIPHSPEAWKLMRHPAIEGIDSQRLVATCEAFMTKVLNRRYSALERLVKPAGLPVPIERVGERLGAFADRIYRARGHHGIFCSELVALYFEELQLSLFEPGGPAANQVSPNDLSSGTCLLKCVEDAFITIDSLGTDFEATQSEFEWPTRERTLPAFVQNRHDADVLASALDAFQDFTRDQLAAQMGESERLGRAMYEGMRSQAVKAAERGHIRYAEKFSSQAAVAFVLMHLERLIVLHQERMSSEPYDELKSKAQAQASLILTRTHLNLRSEIQNRNLRTTIRYALMIMMQLHDRDVSQWKRYKLARKRREFLDNWRSHRRLRRQTLQVANELLETEPPSAATLEYVSEIVGQAQLAALVHSGVSDATLEEGA